MFGSIYTWNLYIVQNYWWVSCCFNVCVTCIRFCSCRPTAIQHFCSSSCTVWHWSPFKSILLRSATGLFLVLSYPKVVRCFIITNVILFLLTKIKQEKCVTKTKEWVHSDFKRVRMIVFTLNFTCSQIGKSRCESARLIIILQYSRRLNWTYI